MAECSVCAWERGSGRTVDTSRSKVAWGREIGVSEASVRRHMRHETDSPLPVSAERVAHPVRSESLKDEALAHLDIPEEAVTSRGASILDENGSWHKVTWDPRRKALADTLKYDDLSRALDGWVPEYVPQVNGVGVGNILDAGDLQIGKANQRGGGTPETLERARVALNAFASRYASGPIALVDGGDPIENVFNTPEQAFTNDLDVPAQIRVFRRFMIEAIKLLAPLTDDFTYVAVPSNHGRFRTGYKAPGGSTDADFGLEISYQLEDVCADHPALQHVKFVRPAELHETAVFDIAGTRVAANHGHESGGIHGHDKWWAGQDHGRMPGWDADLLLMHHYHTPGVAQGGDGRWIISCSSCEPSSDWFTNKAGVSSRRGMTSIQVKDGELLDWRVL